MWIKCFTINEFAILFNYREAYLITGSKTEIKADNMHLKIIFDSAPILEVKD